MHAFGTREGISVHEMMCVETLGFEVRSNSGWRRKDHGRCGACALWVRNRGFFAQRDSLSFDSSLIKNSTSVYILSSETSIKKTISSQYINLTDCLNCQFSSCYLRFSLMTRIKIKKNRIDWLKHQLDLKIKIKYDDSTLNDLYRMKQNFIE